MQMVLHGQCMYPCTVACFQLPVYVAAFTNFYDCYFHKTGFGEKLKSQTQVCNQKSADYISQKFWLYMPHIKTIRKYED